jgi:aspartate kinase
MQRKLKVYKFGGASLKDAEGIRNVASILKKAEVDQLIVVVSAMGKTTNTLETVVAAHAAGNRELAYERLNAVRATHYALCRELLGDDSEEVIVQLNDLFVGAEWVLDDDPSDNYDYDYDQIVSLGELISSRIVAGYLAAEQLPTHWLDARDIILTDNIFREGWVQWTETQQRFDRVLKPLLEQPGFVLTQGFIGSTSENFTTTLGREGSDYSAAIFSFCGDAESMTIWKDVPGVLTADPRLFDHVTKLDRLSYKEAIEMTYYGAKVIHPKTIKPLQNKSIPLFVKSFIEPDEPGTFISDEVDDTYPPMVAVEKDQVLVHISARDFSFVAEHHIKFLFEQITDLRLQVNMMQNTALSFNVCFNDVDDKVDRFVARIDKDFKCILDRNLELITVRHYTRDIVDSLREGRVVMLEERLPKTLMMVLKDVPVMRRKLEPTT